MSKVVILFLAFLSSFNAKAEVLTFDTIGVGTSFAEIPAGYGNFIWTNTGVIWKGMYSESGYYRGATSGEYDAFNWGNQTATVAKTDGSAFNFDGAFFTSAWDSSNLLRLVGYRGNSEAYTMNVLINNTSPLWVNASFEGIDRLAMWTEGSHFAMDNFTYNGKEAHNTPMGSSGIALSLSVLALGFMSRRKRS